MSLKRHEPIQIKAEFTRDEVFDRHDIEVGFVVPFGKKQPAAKTRFTMPEYRRRHVR
jgi:hypothetical protein